MAPYVSCGGVEGISSVHYQPSCNEHTYCSYSLFAYELKILQQQMRKDSIIMCSTLCGR